MFVGVRLADPGRLRWKVSARSRSPVANRIVRTGGGSSPRLSAWEDQSSGGHLVSKTGASYGVGVRLLGLPRKITECP